MSRTIQELWKRLKIAALEYADRGEPVTERDARTLVHDVADSIDPPEHLPKEAVEFYIAEVLAIVEGHEQQSATG